MTIISLFSGVGGLDLGLIQAGNNVIWANETLIQWKSIKEAIDDLPPC